MHDAVVGLGEKGRGFFGFGGAKGQLGLLDGRLYDFVLRRFGLLAFERLTPICLGSLARLRATKRATTIPVLSAKIDG